MGAHSRENTDSPILALARAERRRPPPSSSARPASRADVHFAGGIGEDQFAQFGGWRGLLLRLHVATFGPNSRYSPRLLRCAGNRVTATSRCLRPAGRNGRLQGQLRAAARPAAGRARRTDRALRKRQSARHRPLPQLVPHSAGGATRSSTRPSRFVVGSADGFHVNVRQSDATCCSSRVIPVMRYRTRLSRPARRAVPRGGC